MDKNGFLEKLAMSLAGQVPRAVIEENIRYYDEYISGEVKKGTPLQQVLDGLGDPRLIARSIVDANGGCNDMAGVYEDSTGADSREAGYGTGDRGDGYGTGDGDWQERRTAPIRGFRLSGIGALLLLGAVLIILFLIIGTIIGGIFLLLRPILVPLLLILLIYSLFQGPRRY